MLALLCPQARGNQNAAGFQSIRAAGTSGQCPDLSVPPQAHGLGNCPRWTVEAFCHTVTAPPQRGVCGGPQISWMGKAAEPSDLWLQAG